MKRLLVAALVAGWVSPAWCQTFYVGQILYFAFDRCPFNTLPASGQIMPIQSNRQLFGLIGNAYGGDGTTTFAMPNIPPPWTVNQRAGAVCIVTQGAVQSRN
ncbi:MAG TPA: tail fiber protein [Acidisphaera sp.]|nr:tail fiber protein [Acidisphaera sp.]